MAFDDTALLASIDHTLAAIRAALAAVNDPEQTDEARTQLPGLAGSHAARLVATATNAHFPSVDPAVLEAVRGVEAPAHENDLAGMERVLAGARQMLGGPSGSRE